MDDKRLAHVEQMLARHDERIKSVEQIAKNIEDVVVGLNNLVNEMKHTNRVIEKHEQDIINIKTKPVLIADKVVITLVTAVVTWLIGYVLN